jgi:hypothetical protein
VLAARPTVTLGLLHSSMMAPVTLVNRHQPLLLARPATSPFNALGNRIQV